MRSRRAGHGCSTGARPGQPSRGPRTAATWPDRALGGGDSRRFWQIGDIPVLVAAIERARIDVRAHEQTEAYWRLTWSEQ